MTEELHHKNESEIKDKLNLKTVNKKLKKVGFGSGLRGMSKGMDSAVKLLSKLEDDILVLQHNQIEFGKYLDDIVERLERIENGLFKDNKKPVDVSISDIDNNN